MKTPRKRRESNPNAVGQAFTIYLSRVAYDILDDYVKSNGVTRSKAIERILIEVGIQWLINEKD